jgi:hypothetical protein
MLEVEGFDEGTPLSTGIHDVLGYRWSRAAHCICGCERGWISSL